LRISNWEDFDPLNCLSIDFIAYMQFNFKPPDELLKF